ncbi:MAG: hypothetical protein NZV14_07090 [Bryobacteraceae bacterium]|nr:hypothetical protein [Bryobacteraceae bacterium]MDW8377908.1 hypothetical protein [Bryobacterales bacterium]
MVRSLIRAALLVVISASCALPQKYNGPRPPKPDRLYLLHATNLIETEVTEAREEKRKDDIAYVVDGASSPAKTPLAEPIFLIECKSIQPEKLQLYRLEVTKSGKREIVFPGKRRKDGPRPLHLTIKRLGEGIYRVEANEYLPNGEYAISPEGSNTVFLFQVY